MQIQWGSVGEWVSGVGSLAAVFTAIGLSVRAERQMRLYRTEDEARLRTVRAQDEATRAREIAAQLTIKDNGGSSDGEQHYRWSALVTNRAPQGFTNVHVGALVNGVSHTAPGPDAVA